MVTKMTLPVPILVMWVINWLVHLNVPVSLAGFGQEYLLFVILYNVLNLILQIMDIYSYLVLMIISQCVLLDVMMDIILLMELIPSLVILLITPQLSGVHLENVKVSFNVSFFFCLACKSILDCWGPHPMSF